MANVLIDNQTISEAFVRGEKSDKISCLKLGHDRERADEKEKKEDDDNNMGVSRFNSYFATL